MRGRVHFMALDKERAMRFTTNRLVALEEQTGRSINEIAASMQGAPSITDLRRLFAIGCGVSPDEAGDIIDDIGAQRAGELIGEAFTAAFCGGDDTEKKATATAA